MLQFRFAACHQGSSAFPGIEHVAGDMFVDVPKADAVFLKWICHNWNDEQCVKLLRKCYDALDDGGKVIAVDYIMLDEPAETVDFKCMAAMDVLMMTFYLGGEERTEEEFTGMFQQAGFRKFRRVCDVYGMGVFELHK